MNPPIPIGPGVSFWPYATDGVDPHPYFVISHPVNGRVLVVNVTEAAKHFDKTCILQVGEHVFIDEYPSAVYYKKAAARDEIKLGLLLANFQKLVRHGPNLKPEVLTKILDGARTSPHMFSDLLEHFGIK